MSTGEQTLGLNRSERVYLALEGVAGAIAQTHVLRFRGAASTDALRDAVRALVRETARMRAGVTPSLFGWRLRIRADGPAVDRLFDDAFRTRPDVGGDELSLRAFLTELANEPFDLRGQLPFRARVLPTPAEPLLVLQFHHLVCDGRGAMALLARLMAHLNGASAPQSPPTPAEDPSMIPALLPWPRSLSAVVRSLWRSFWLHRGEEKSRRQFQAVTAGLARPSFGPLGVALHAAGTPLATIKEAAQRRGCTVTELVVALLAVAFAGDAPPDPRLAVTIRLSLDLRPYFPADRRPRIGNYVASFLVHLARWRDLDGTVADVRAQLREQVRRFAAHEMSYPFLLAELTPWLLGRRGLAHAVRILKRRGRLQPITFHYSNLGSVDALNVEGGRTQLAALNFFTPAIGPYVGCVGLADRLSLGITYPASEIERAVIDRVLANFDELLAGSARRV